MPVQQHDQVPAFTARNELDGTIVDYRDVWQRWSVVLVSLSADDETSAAYTQSLREIVTPLRHAQAVLVVTSDSIAGIPQPGVLVADQWGEIRYVRAASDAARLPSAQDLVDWVEYLRTECPECEGEAR